MTNFEKIKSMNSYQLALFISTIESNEETNVKVYAEQKCLTQRPT